LVNKIAAGEVVERPASVVKELVENAIDAGARSVVIEIEAGGKSLVRVRDDGCGMDRTDAERSIERHATSKLRELGDLQTIASHGFRGEALPSIASVSKLVLRTRTEGDPAGTEVELQHGRLVHVRDAGHPRGTTVEVRDLFGAVPARRKFLRADATEAGHVAEAVTLLALARPETGFLLRSGGRTVLEAPPVDGLAARLYQVAGADAGELAPVEGGESWASVRGFVSRPERPASRSSVRLFVNGRPVRDRALAKAVSDAYRATGVKDPRPEAFVFVEVPTHLVDVNVHPAKSEVRFAEPRVVFAAVERSVREALSVGARAAPAVALDRIDQVHEAAEAYVAHAAAGRVWSAEPTAPPVAGRPAPVAPGLFASGPASVLGQHRRTYIVATDGEDLLLLDQHTAHERVRFEALLQRLNRRSPESQLLLAPLVVQLEPRLLPLVEANAEALADLGYDVEPFGGGSVRIAAVPAALGGRDPGPGLSGILRDLLEREASEWAVATTRERLAATLACHSAVRAGQALGSDTMAAIVRDLATAQHPTLCPHGRPTMVRIPRDDVSRWFGRTGWRRE
jgi:DNA mismatch repair protein MutL